MYIWPVAEIEMDEMRLWDAAAAVARIRCSLKDEKTKVNLTYIDELIVLAVIKALSPKLNGRPDDVASFEARLAAV